MSDPIKANALVGGLLNQVTVDSGLNVSTMLSLFRHFRHLDPNAVPETTLPVTVTPNYHYAAGSYGDEHPPVGRTLRIGGVHVHEEEVEGRSSVEVYS